MVQGFVLMELFWGLEFGIQGFSILWRVLSSHHFMIIFIRLMREALFSMLLLSLVPGTAETLLCPQVLTIASTTPMLWWTPHLTDLRGQHHFEVSKWCKIPPIPCSARNALVAAGIDIAVFFASSFSF